MIGHLGLTVSDLGVARRFWAGLMPLVDFEPFLDHDDEFAYRPAGGKPGTYLFFYPPTLDDDVAYSPERPGLQHLAFMVDTRARVDELAAQVAAMGCEIVEPAREWPTYHEGYYAVFFRDPDGFTIEIVNHRDKSTVA